MGSAARCLPFFGVRWCSTGLRSEKISAQRSKDLLSHCEVRAQSPSFGRMPTVLIVAEQIRIGFITIFAIMNQHALCKLRIESRIARLVSHVVVRKQREDKTES